MSAPDRDPARVREAHAIRDAAAASPTWTALRARPDWPAWAARLDALLALMRHHEGPASAAPADDRVRVAHWNLEHGNHYEAIADALTSHPDLAGADLVSLNEADLGMARSGNRDVVGELAARLGRHAVWAPLFLESTRGRDDDALNAIADDNAESLFGLGLLSRWPLESVRLVPLPGPEEVLFDRERMLGRFVALVARVAHPRTPFTAVTVHLEVHRTRAHRAAQMRAVLAALANEHGPVVITGDWNTHTFDRGTPNAVPAAAVALLAWPEGALARRFRRADRGTHREALFDALAAAGFAWEACNDFEPSLGMRFSRLGEVHALPAPLRALASHGLAWAERRARLRLDWIAERGFAHAGEALTVAGLDGPGRASDHAPIVATLRLP
jgi:endonuclease/exonuclease/phosphatase family metal-dependent hydrolase